ncbi:hypothetical protein D9M71_779790 [compost metagenome]
MLFNQIRQALDIPLAQAVVIHLLHLLQTRPAQQRTARRRGFKQAMQIGAENLPIDTLRAIAATIVQLHGGIFQGRSGGNASVNLIAADLGILQCKTPAHVA